MECIDDMTKFKGKFTQHQVDTAIEVLMDSDYVNNWVSGELKAYGVDEDSTEGKRFKEKRSREIALKLLT